jgi:hypothetical protein
MIAAGAVLGLCAGLLWTAQGSLMLAYPTEDQKGTFIGIFWSIFNLGGVVGASVSLGQNFHSEVRCRYTSHILRAHIIRARQTEVRTNTPFVRPRDYLTLIYLVSNGTYVREPPFSLRTWLTVL